MDILVRRGRAASREPRPDGPASAGYPGRWRYAFARRSDHRVSSGTGDRSRADGWIEGHVCSVERHTLVERPGLGGQRHAGHIVQGLARGLRRSCGPTTAEASQGVTITFMRADGTILPSPRILLPAKGDDDKFGELAISNNGRHIIVAFPHEVYFLDGNGRIVNRIDLADKATSRPGVERCLAQPTFSPDSHRVAFKSLVGGHDANRADAIVFLSPDGKELSRVAVPTIRPGTTRPADQTP